MGERERVCVQRRVTFQRLLFKGGLGLRRWLAKPNSAITDALGRMASGEKNKKGGAPISRRTFCRRGQGRPPPERSGGPDSDHQAEAVRLLASQVGQAFGDHLG